MKFNVEQRKHPNLPKFPTEDLDIAKKFADTIQKELQDFVKAVVMYGSGARKSVSAHEKIYSHDIDMLIIINDLTVITSAEVIQAYRVIVERIASDISTRLHINTLKLTSFWDYMRTGDPIAVNMLRDGIPLYDAGFFEPLQYLLFQGRIRPTKESMWIYFARAPQTLNNADWHVLQATLDLYWAVIDAAHAALMKLDQVPPTPAHVADYINKHMVQKRLVTKKYADTMAFFYELSKSITHRKITRVSGQEYEKHLARAKDFVNVMKKVIEGR